MAKAGLLKAVCTVALLAAAPAFAQTATQPAATGPGNTPNAPSTHGSTGMSPSMKMGAADDSQSSGAMNQHSTHRSAMGGHESMRGRDDTSQNAAVDRLNDQSFQAAQSGQAYSGGSGSMGAGTMGSGGTGSRGMGTGGMGSGGMSGGAPGGSNSSDGGGSGGGSGM